MSEHPLLKHGSRDGDERPEVLAARAVILTLVMMVVVAGAWLIFAPHLGPPNTETSPLDAVTRGGRVPCAPPIFNLFADRSLVTASRQDCLEVGRVRMNYGGMLLLAGGAGWIAGTIALGRVGGRLAKEPGEKR